jgi:hypothetical protein
MSATKAVVVARAVELAFWPSEGDCVSCVSCKAQRP